MILSGCVERQKENKSRLSEQSTGYVIGVDIGARLKNQPHPIDLPSVLAGIEDYYNGRKLRIPLDSISKLQEEIMKLGHAIEAEMAKNRDRALAFLDSNGKKSDVRKMSGIQYTVIEQGENSETPSDSDIVMCNLSCSLLDGTSLKDTRKSKSPERFQVAKALPGLVTILKTMSKGARLKVWVPPEAAYGREGVRGSIPPYSLLVYDIELLRIEGK